MKMWRVWFTHSKITESGYSHRTTDWTLVEGETVEQATTEAKQWVRENRFQSGCRNRVKVLEVREVA